MRPRGRSKGPVASDAAERTQGNCGAIKEKLKTTKGVEGNNPSLYKYWAREKPEAEYLGHEDAR